MHHLKYVILSIAFFLQAFASFGQTIEPTTNNLADSVSAIKNSILKGEKPNIEGLNEFFANDSLASGLKNLPVVSRNFPIDTTSLDTLNRIQTKSNIEHTIDYTARDSIFFDVRNKKMFLYGAAKIEYGSMTLEAERIDLDWIENTIEANYQLDSLGKKLGKPVYTEKSDTYVTDNMVYNIKTGKAVIHGVITEQDGGFIHGERVKKNEFDELYIKEARYTTCDLEEPHFVIKSKRLKVIPKNKIVSGPFNLQFGEIPLPIGFLFGMFPQPKEKASGILVPSYGEDPTRGFFLRNGGYYFSISDYMDLKVTGELYSGGSFGINTASRYVKRYKYSGNLNVRYNKSVVNNFDSENFSKDFWVNWSHAPQSKGTSRFSGSVSAGTSSFNQNVNQVSQSFTQSINAQFNSNISYAKTFKGTPFNMTLNLRHNQNIQTELVNLTLPDLSVNATRVFPLKGLSKSNNGVLSKLGLSYSMSAKNDLSNAAVSNSRLNVINRSSLDDSVISFSTNNLDQLFKRAKNGMRHNIPISTSFNLLKFLTVSPSFNYSEVWFPKELKYTYVPEQEGIRVDTVSGFSRAGSWNTGAAVNTRIYGTYFFPGKKIQAIRHVITPSVSFSYRPDFGEEKFGVYETVQINEAGDTQVLSKYDGFAYAGPDRGKSSSLNFSVTNNIEMKVKTKKDTVNEFKKVKLFDNLAFSSSYNLAADSFKLSDIRMSARTSLFNNKFTINFTGTIDPYVYILDSIGSTGNIHQRKIDKFTWNNGNGLGQLKNATIALGLNLKGKSSGGGSQNNSNQSINNNNNNNNGFDDTDPLNEFDDIERSPVYDALDPNLYVDFSIPWALRANYSYNYSKTGFAKSNVTQSLNFSGNISITQKTKIGFNSGYDLENKEFTVTRLNLTRDLHCWNLAFNWVPFGPRQEYFVEVKVVSTLLSDLKLDKKRRSSFNTFGGF